MQLNYILKQEDMIAMAQNFGRHNQSMRRMFWVYRLAVPVMVMIIMVWTVYTPGAPAPDLLVILGLVLLWLLVSAAWMLAVRFITRAMMKSSAKKSYPADYAAPTTLTMDDDGLLIESDRNGETRTIELAYNEISAITSDETHYFFYFDQNRVIVLPFIDFHPKEQKDIFMMKLEQYRKAGTGV